MTDSDLTKYDWRRRLGDGGSGVYSVAYSLSIYTYVCMFIAGKFTERKVTFLCS